MSNNHTIAPVPGNYSPYHPNIGFKGLPPGTTEAEAIAAHSEAAAASSIHRAVDRQGHRRPIESFKLRTLAAAVRVQDGKPLAQPQIDALLQAAGACGRELDASEIRYVLKQV